MSQVGFSFRFFSGGIDWALRFPFSGKDLWCPELIFTNKKQNVKRKHFDLREPTEGGTGGWPRRWSRWRGTGGACRWKEGCGGGLALDKHESLKWYLNASFASAFSSPCVLAHQRWRDLPYLDVSQRRRMSTRCQRSPPSLQVRAPTVSEADRCFGPHGPTPLWRWWARSPSPYRCRIRTPAFAQRNFGAWTG